MLKKIEARIWRSRLFSKSFSDDEVKMYVGDYRACYFTYASDEKLREKAASGGSVTAILRHLLDTSQVDGALVCRSVITDGKVRAEFFIARDYDELRLSQGSKYTAVYFASQAVPLIKAFEGRLAVVALPCDAMILHRLREKSPDVDRKIVCVIALLCGHNSEPELTDHVVDKLRPNPDTKLVEYLYRVGHWRGKLTARFDDGNEVIKPYSYFSDYRLLYYFAQPKCKHCFDHFGYFCDISAGDIWSPHMKKEPIKHTALITRSLTGEAIIEEVVQSGCLVARQQGIREIVNGQARVAPYHYDVTVRSRVGRLFGMNIKQRTVKSPRWNHYIVAFLALANERISRSRMGQRIVMRLPRRVIRLYLYAYKAIESL